MSDTTITAEERARLRSVLSEHGNPQVEDRIILRMLNTIEQAEANVARLTEERDWLADKLSDHCLADGGDCNIQICPTYIACRNATPKVWIEAARVAVADSEVKG